MKKSIIIVLQIICLLLMVTNHFLVALYYVSSSAILLGSNEDLSCEDTEFTVVTKTITAANVFNNNDYSIDAKLNDAAPADVSLRNITLKYYLKRLV